MKRIFTSQETPRLLLDMPSQEHERQLRRFLGYLKDLLNRTLCGSWRVSFIFLYRFRISDFFESLLYRFAQFLQFNLLAKHFGSCDSLDRIFQVCPEDRKYGNGNQRWPEQRADGLE